MDQPERSRDWLLGPSQIILEEKPAVIVLKALLADDCIHHVLKEMLMESTSMSAYEALSSARYVESVCYLRMEQMLLMEGEQPQGFIFPTDTIRFWWRNYLMDKDPNDAAWNARLLVWYCEIRYGEILAHNSSIYEKFTKKPGDWDGVKVFKMNESLDFDKLTKAIED